MTDRLNWKKSSYSSAKGEECLEVGNFHGFRRMAIRDSTNKAAGFITFDMHAWTKFLSQTKTDQP